MLNIIFIHGLESSGKGFKGRLFQEVLPGCLTPDFKAFNPEISYQKLFKIRMKELLQILKDKQPWILIGSSFGGLMATQYTLKFPTKVSKLILLAPFLDTSILNLSKFQSIEVATTVFHGKYDKIVPIEASRTIAKKLFKNLYYNIVDDDHQLLKTVVKLDWQKIIGDI